MSALEIKQVPGFTWLLTLFLLLNLDVRFSAAEISEASKPNVVFLLADDLGWTGLSCYGSDFYETPNLDALAASGMKFSNAYSACTVCSPTRASVMTGMYPARLRCTDFIAGQHRPFAKLAIPDWTKRLESRYTTLAEAMKSEGYRTAHIGKWHLQGRGPVAVGTDPLSQGFDVSIQKPEGTRGYFLPVAKDEDKENGPTEKVEQPSEYLTDWLTDRACDFIEEAKDGPFFLYFAYHTPHTPIQGRPDLVEYFQQKVNPEAIHHNPVYAAMVSSLDQSVGRVLQELERHRLRQNTLIVFTSDNGGLTQRYGKHDDFTENLPLRRGKGSAFEGGVRVPAILSWPPLISGGEVCHTPIMTIDYYPTILDLSGAEGDSEHNRLVDGLSLKPLLRDPELEFERNLYWHYPHYHAGGDGPYSAVRSRNFRLIEFYEDRSLRLFDLSRDLSEQNDLSKDLPRKATELHADLQRWRASIDAQMPTLNPRYDPSREEAVERN